MITHPDGLAVPLKTYASLDGLRFAVRQRGDDGEPLVADVGWGEWWPLTAEALVLWSLCQAHGYGVLAGNPVPGEA